MLPYYIEVEKNLRKVKAIPLSALGSRLEYVPLETSPISIISSIDNVFITDSLIFVSDSDQRLLAFDISGRYIRQIGTNGRGPGEYQTVENFIVDNKHKKIYLLTFRRVNVYDFNGNFIREIKLDFPSSEIIIDDNENLILHPFSSAQPKNEEVYSWYFYDEMGNEKLKIKNTIKRTKGGITIPYSPLYMYNGIPHFMEFGVDTLYTYSDNLRTPYAVLNLGKLKYPNDPTLQESLTIDNRIWVYKIQESKHFLFINLWWGHDSILYCVFNKPNSVFSEMNESGFTNDIDYGLNFWPMKVINDSLFVDCKEAIEIIEYARNSQSKVKEQNNHIKELANQLSETSNPVLIILKN